MFTPPHPPTSPHPRSVIACAVAGIIQQRATAAAEQRKAEAFVEAFAEVARLYGLNPSILAQVAAKETAL